MRPSLLLACLTLIAPNVYSRDTGQANEKPDTASSAVETSAADPEAAQKELEKLINGRWVLDPDAMAEYGPYKASLENATPEQRAEYMAMLRSMSVDLTVMGGRMSLINHHDGKMIREVHRWRYVSQDIDGSYNLIRVSNTDERPFSLEVKDDWLVYDLGKPLVFKRAEDIPLPGSDRAMGAVEPTGEESSPQ